MLSEEPLFPLVDAVCKATGRRPHLSTVMRWCKNGLASRSGAKLECISLGGRYVTSVAAVRRFIELTSAQIQPVKITYETPRQTERRAKRAAEVLATKLGNGRTKIQRSIQARQS